MLDVRSPRTTIRPREAQARPIETPRRERSSRLARHPKPIERIASDFHPALRPIGAQTARPISALAARRRLPSGSGRTGLAALHLVDPHPRPAGPLGELGQRQAPPLPLDLEARR